MFMPKFWTNRGDLKGHHTHRIGMQLLCAVDCRITVGIQACKGPAVRSAVSVHVYRHARAQSRPAAPSQETPAEEDVQPLMLSVSPSAESVQPRKQDPGRPELPCLEETPLSILQLDEQAAEQGQAQEPGRGNEGHAPFNAELPAPVAAELHVPSASAGLHEIMAGSDGSMLQQPEDLGKGGLLGFPLGMAPDATDDTHADTGPSADDSQKETQLPLMANQQRVREAPLHLAPALSGGSVSSIGTAASSHKGSAAASSLPASRLTTPVLPVALHISSALQETLNRPATFDSDTDSEISDTDISGDDSDEGPVTPSLSLSLRPGTALKPLPVHRSGAAGTALKPVNLHGSGPGITVKPVTLHTALRATTPAPALRLSLTQNGFHPSEAGCEPSLPMMRVPAQQMQPATAKQLASGLETSHPSVDEEAVNAGTNGREERSPGVTGPAAGHTTTSLQTAGAPLPAPSPAPRNSSTLVRPLTPLHTLFQPSANAWRACTSIAASLASWSGQRMLCSRKCCQALATSAE